MAKEKLSDSEQVTRHNRNFRRELYRGQTNINFSDLDGIKQKEQKLKERIIEWIGLIEK